MHVKSPFLLHPVRFQLLPPKISLIFFGANGAQGIKKGVDLVIFWKHFIYLHIIFMMNFQLTVHIQLCLLFIVDEIFLFFFTTQKLWDSILYQKEKNGQETNTIKD